MTTRKSKPSLLYTHGASSRWFQAAVAMLDDRLVTLCVQQWQGAQAKPIPVTVLQRPYLKRG